jgi:DNA-binding MarR family transcriptional regulator
VPDDDFAGLADLLLDLGRELRMRTTLVPGSPTLTQTQGTLMRFVHANPGCTPSEAAAGTGLQRTNVSTALRELRGLGYLDTTPHESDARGLRIRATERADENLALLRTRWMQLLEAAWHESEPGGEPGDLHITRATLERLAGPLQRMPRA